MITRTSAPQYCHAPTHLFFPLSPARVTRRRVGAMPPTPPPPDAPPAIPRRRRRHADEERLLRRQRSSVPHARESTLRRRRPGRRAHARRQRRRRRPGPRAQLQGRGLTTCSAARTDARRRGAGERDARGEVVRVRERVAVTGVALRRARGERRRRLARGVDHASVRCVSNGVGDASRTTRGCV